MINQKVAARSLVLLIFFSVLHLPYHVHAQSRQVKVIELRNYLLRAGQREKYIEAFETNFVDTLNAKGNYVLGQYRIKGEDDHFVWIRGFDDMPARKPALESFFSSGHWAKYGNTLGQHLIGYTNVYLLKPLAHSATTANSDAGFDTEWFGRPKGVTVVDFYIANEMLKQLTEFMQTKYDAVLHAAGVKDISYWVSETSPNNYPGLPVFQDKNLLVTISFYKDEAEYQSVMNKIEATMNEDLKFERGRLVTTKTTWILYPTSKSLTSTARGVSKQ